MVMVLERQTRSQWRRACVLIDNLEGRNAWGIGLLGKDAMRRLELGSLGRYGCGCGCFALVIERARASVLLSDACRDAAKPRGVRVACVSRGAMFLEDPRMMMVMMMMNNASPESKRTCF